MTLTLLYWCYFPLTLGLVVKNCLPKSKSNYLQILSESKSRTYNLITGQLRILYNENWNSTCQDSISTDDRLSLLKQASMIKRSRKFQILVICLISASSLYQSDLDSFMPGIHDHIVITIWDRLSSRRLTFSCICCQKQIMSHFELWNFSWFLVILWIHNVTLTCIHKLIWFSSLLEWWMDNLRTCDIIFKS